MPTDNGEAQFFFGALFLSHSPAEQNWATISSSHDLSGACFDEVYVPLPDWIIADLYAKENGGGAVSLTELQKKERATGAVVAVQLDDDTSCPEVVFFFFRLG